MEILQPAVETVEISKEMNSRTDVPKELIDAGITLKNVEILNRLGLSSEQVRQIDKYKTEWYYREN